MRKTVYILGMAMALMFGACTDTLDLTADPAEEGVMAGDGLAFAVNATRGFSGSHSSQLSQSEEEIVINPDNFHVVLFSKSGEVKQIWANQELTELEEFDSSMGEYIKKYYVKIPRHDISDEIVNYIRDNNFKLAVFANWDGYPEFTTSAVQDANGIYKNNIFYISHCRKDDSYSSGSGVDGQVDDSEVFGFITGKGFKMGIAQEWVCERFKDDAAAEAAVRSRYILNSDGSGVFHSNTKPVITNTQGEGSVFTAMKDYDYRDVWQIWNFGGEYNLGYDFYNSSNQSLRSQWAGINNDWYAIAFNEGSRDYYTKWISGSYTFRGLTLQSTEDNDYGNMVYSGFDDLGHSIVLRPTARVTDNSTAFNTEAGSYIHFKVPADGALYIKCRANADQATLVARRGALSSSGKDIYTNTITLDGVLQTWSLDYSNDKNQIVRVTGEPADLVLYAVGGDVMIYEIDYIKSRTLQMADRQMINPASTPEGGISMYGIQDFKPLPLSVWPDGTTFNLSRYESTHTGSAAPGYNYRTISLLRSVAKVEVLVPTSIFPEPSHMFMRTINRFSRSAPLDVFTPTNIIWNGWDASKSDYTEYNSSTGVPDFWRNTHYYHQALGVDDEAESIRDKGFTYKYQSTDPQEYKNAVAWLFGLWKKEYGWDWDGETINIAKDGPYPRVFNTRISRSDFAHMIDGGRVTVDGEQYYYYYAYLPEKNITDPNDKASLGESPKVMRIEMRFGDRNSDVNLDDNASYRIYFTPGGKGLGINSRDDYDDAMEKGNENEASNQMKNLHNMYPVMRNHLYRFKITGIEMNRLNIDVEVKGPEVRDIDYYFE